MTEPRSKLDFPKSVRVRSKLDFASIYDQGIRISDSQLSITAARNQLGRTRLGLSVSKRCGNAVQRNLLKRLLRESFRGSRAELPIGLDLIVQPRATTATNLATMQQSLRSLAHRIAKKLPRPPTIPS